MKRLRLPISLLLAGVLVGFVAASAQAQLEPAGAHKVASVEGITEYKLDNGFRYLIFPDPSSANVVINLTVLVGSRHEGYGETGMAHLLEHMLFKGSKLFPQIDKALEKHGAVMANATTWVDRTNYYEVMPGTAENLDFGIRFEADRLVNSFIRREDLAKEMTVVRNEFEMGENSPSYILSQRMLSAAYQWHNYGHSTIGNRSDIERVPIEKLQTFYRKYYQPDNVLLTVAGKFDEAKAHELIARHFGALPRPKRALEQTYTEEPAQDGERTVLLRRTGKVPLVGVVYHVPAAADPDYAAVEVMETVLLMAPAGRLYQALVKTRKATKVEGGSYSWHDPAVLEVTAQVADKVSPEEVRDIALKVMEEFGRTATTAEEVERARRELLAARERKLTSSVRIALELSEWAGAGDWRLLFLHRDRIAKVTPADVDRVARKYLLKSNRTVGIFLPTPPEQIARATIPEVNNLQAVLKDYKGGKALAQGEKFDPTPENIDARTKRIQLRDGLKVALLSKKTRGERVIATLTLHFGNEQSLRGQTTAAEFIGKLMPRGTKKYTREQIKDQLDKLGASLRVSSGAGYLQVGLQAKRQTLAPVLDLLHEILRHPTFPEDEFGILKRQSRQDLEESLAEPASLASSSLRRKLNPYPKDDVRYEPTIEEEIERVERVTRDQVARLYVEQLGASAGELAIVGDFDAGLVLGQVEKLVAGWKSPVPFARIAYTAKLNVPGGRETIVTPDKKNAYYKAAEVLALKDTSPDYPALLLGNYILGSGGFTSLLTDRVRQKEGLSYGVGSSLTAEALDEYAEFRISAICNPKVMDKLDATIAAVVAGVLKEGVSPKHLEEARRGFLEGRKLRRSEDGGLAVQLRTNLYLGRTMKFAADLEARVAKVSREEVNAALRRYIDLRRLIIIHAGDLGPAAGKGAD